MTISSRRLRRAVTRAIPSYLVATTTADLSSVQLTLETMPFCAHGRVIIVAEHDEAVPTIELPARFCVTVLRAAPGAPVREAARIAVEAWASEMLCDPGIDFVTGSGTGAAEAHSAAPAPQVWLAGDAAHWAELTEQLLRTHELPAASLHFGSGLGTP